MGNELMRAQQYLEAKRVYLEYITKRPELAAMLSVNVKLCEKRSSSSFISGDLGDGSLGCMANSATPWALGSSAAMCGIKALGGSRYQALNDDPKFLFSFDTPIATGFIRVTYLIEIDPSARWNRSVIYLDYGGGYNEVDKFEVHALSGNLLSRLIYIDRPLLRMRFDPLDHPGEFSIGEFDVSRVSDARARAEIAELVRRRTRSSANNDQVLNGILHDKYLHSITPEVPLSYEDWIEYCEHQSLPTAECISNSIQSFNWLPKISVVVATYNTEEALLRECIESVLTQSYRSWELCIADDCSTKDHVYRVLKEYAARDARIKIERRSSNGHISEASNTALNMASGEFVALLDHDDKLANHALYFVVEALNHNQHAQILYSDEDKIDQIGVRYSPHFKPKWNPTLFFSQNYVSHLGVYRRELICRIGGFRPGTEGSQDQDLLLRCLPYVRESQIVHIPRVLYHWRAVPGSTALAANEKSYTTEAGIKALRDFFHGQGQIDINVHKGLRENTYKVDFPLPRIPPKVTILIPTRDQKKITEVAIESILNKTNYPNYEIVILDNQSEQRETLEYFSFLEARYESVQVLRYPHAFNYSAINNFGVRQTGGELVALVNNDVEVIAPDWLTEMVRHAVRDSVGCVGAKLYYPDDSVQHAGVILGIRGVAGHSHKHFPRSSPGYFARAICPQNVSAVTGACLLVKRSIYEAVGGLNEVDLKVAFNDIDFCLRVREAGYDNVWTPYAELYHHESISRGYEDTDEKLKRFNSEVRYMKERWGSVLQSDPYYNPNLTLESEDFAYAYPPRI